MKRAHLSWIGESQVVLLPLECRFEGDEVEVRCERDTVILKPLRTSGWPDGFWAWVDAHRQEMELGVTDD